jgi:hypothetical protein
MAMSKEDWQAVKARLDSFYSPVVLDCDGYRLSLKLVRVSTFENAIAVYVDGWFRGEWLLNDCEQRRRFMRPMTTRLYRRNDFKGFNKRELKRLRIDTEKAITVYSSHWKNIGALIRHLKSNNVEISLIKEEEKEAAA